MTISWEVVWSHWSLLTQAAVSSILNPDWMALETYLSELMKSSAKSWSAKLARIRGRVV